ncbi:hypothetical protein AY599_15970 [Leptolyngbya valderiana BDU 20041]|nr:hypothetical protein AY599_15970 [Leptolyngbya valderiana BDU 20041]
MTIAAIAISKTWRISHTIANDKTSATSASGLPIFTVPFLRGPTRFSIRDRSIKAVSIER